MFVWVPIRAVVAAGLPANNPAKASRARRAPTNAFKHPCKKLAGTNPCCCGSRPAGEQPRESFARKVRSHERLQALPHIRD